MATRSTRTPASTAAVAACGDGVIRAGVEACDDGNREDADACLNTCALATCGDGRRRRDLQEGDQGFEQCDDGNAIDTDGCRNNCLAARCGDSVVRRGGGLRRRQRGADRCVPEQLPVRSLRRRRGRGERRGL